MHRIFLAGITAAMLGCSASAYGQALVVIGNTPAAQCFENAVWRRAYSSSLNACDSALASTNLTSRDRQRTWVNRAVINLHLERPEDALHDLDQAVEAGFDAPEIDMNRSAAYIRLGLYEEAVEAATRALDAGLDEAEKAYFNRAVAYERMGRIADAYDDFRAAAAAAPNWRQPREQLERFSVDRPS
jgi:tetratricopeptide (TPR) repeat protein